MIFALYLISFNREKTMKPDQDWPSVWPGPRTFHPASVPLPVRQGFAHLKGQYTPGKYANIELMKVPNFLHLTPVAIKRHCDAIKKFCTAWPEGMKIIHGFCFHNNLQFLKQKLQIVAKNEHN